ncbi:MAG: L-aspartate oxidase [Bacteroidetes bacterium]|nr:MAG: L-aspartate oxidase [Bacteroidota bacterium]REK04866.1 MAG: L-aspartate oxidase [Bacteroidota bacterium]REK36338.1 MAG: L-aspartate oxidase [Bacteroidota bacterium]REK50996.1 MAG: L-aspartate oxidase [Bacteroidota bacterium]
MRHEYDFLVIGSGIAGLSYALKVADHGKVLIITKAEAEESNTKYAQGGIAGVLHGPDTFEKHVQDTLESGAGLCDEKIVRMVVTEGADRIREIIEWGTRFDKNKEGEYDLVMEGGHSEYRVLHYKDRTGNEIERALLESIRNHPNISLNTHYFALDLITQHHLGEEVSRSSGGIKCFGAYALNLESGNVETILSRVCMVATGGAGHIYRTTTNPAIATGDGIAMVYRAKGLVRDMEFIQFHPTALYEPGKHPAFLISEAVRGEGAILRTSDGNDFMKKYDERGSLAPRDIVARAIDNEMKIRGDEHVLLDCIGIDTKDFASHFPTILEKCLKEGIDPSKDMIPVAPAAHYICGGIAVDEWSRTSIEGLYASGECAGTGLHGGNRLASNSLLEALVFSHRASIKSIENASNTEFNQSVPDWNAEGTTQPNEMILITQNLNELQSVMSNYVGIVRSSQRLKRAIDRLRILYGETEALYERTVVSPALCELRNMITVAYLIVKFAMARKESIGLHYSTDFAPQKS